MSDIATPDRAYDFVRVLLFQRGGRRLNGPRHSGRLPWGEGAAAASVAKVYRARGWFTWVDFV